MRTFPELRTTARWLLSRAAVALLCVLTLWAAGGAPAFAHAGHSHGTDRRASVSAEASFTMADAARAAWPEAEHHGVRASAEVAIDVAVGGASASYVAAPATSDAADCCAGAGDVASVRASNVGSLIEAARTVQGPACACSSGCGACTCAAASCCAAALAPAWRWSWWSDHPGPVASRDDDGLAGGRVAPLPRPPNPSLKA